MIALAWPIAVVIVAGLCFISFERHAKRTRASTSDAIEQRLYNFKVFMDGAVPEIDTLTQRVDTLERLVSDPTQGLAEQVRQVKNSNRFGK